MPNLSVYGVRILINKLLAQAKYHNDGRLPGDNRPDSLASTYEHCAALVEDHFGLCNIQFSEFGSYPTPETEKS